MKSQPTVVEGKIRLKRFDPSDHDGLDKARAKARTDKNQHRIDDLQRLLYANANRAILLVFQGVDASGKDGSIRSVLHRVNPAGVTTVNFKVPSAEESAHDFLWRVHKAVPPFGQIGVFNRSHYESVLVERVLKLVPRKIWKPRYQQIIDFERMLVASGVLILKFCLIISREEQGKRFKERLANPHKHWKFKESDLVTRQHWDNYLKAYEDMLNATSHADARWHLIPADQNWYRDHLIAHTVVEAMKSMKQRWPRLDPNPTPKGS
jgi:PPK2 family polyphosphate:nucleotide phosphotransferase